MSSTFFMFKCIFSIARCDCVSTRKIQLQMCGFFFYPKTSSMTPWTQMSVLESRFFFFPLGYSRLFCGVQALGCSAQVSLVVTCGVSCSSAYEISVPPPGIKPAWKSGFFTNRPRRKSLKIHCKWSKYLLS